MPPGSQLSRWPLCPWCRGPHLPVTTLALASCVPIIELCSALKTWPLIPQIYWRITVPNSLRRKPGLWEFSHSSKLLSSLACCSSWRCLSQPEIGWRWFFTGEHVKPARCYCCDVWISEKHMSIWGDRFNVSGWILSSLEALDCPGRLEPDFATLSYLQITVLVF